MSLRLITGPTALPVSLETAKQHLKVQHAADDELITLMLRAAASGAEQLLNRALMTQTWQLIVDAFPTAEFRLERPRVQSISSITYIDPAGAQQTLGADAYTLDPDLLPGWVLPALGTNWPATRDQANAVRVTFVTGYGSDPTAVPETVRAWILLHLGASYRNREAFAAGSSVAELPGRFHDALLDSERLYW
jgi:uncharacterized phiE125 gp8 family phage protein